MHGTKKVKNNSDLSQQNIYFDIPWIYEHERGLSIKRNILNLGLIYHHNPLFIKSFFNQSFDVREEFSYAYKNNSEYYAQETVVRTNQMRGLFLER